MDQAFHEVLQRWANFYVIVGGAAAALTGLQFVVQTLLATDLHRSVDNENPAAGIETFGSPTVVHLTLVLVVSALLSVPWPTVGELRIALGALGGAALVYGGIVAVRARRQTIYTPVAEDWVFHVVLPLVSYAGILFAAVHLHRDSKAALFSVAGATLLLICVAIHNAWDTVTYLTIKSIERGGVGGSRALATPAASRSAGSSVPQSLPDIQPAARRSSHDASTVSRRSSPDVSSTPRRPSPTKGKRR